MVEAFEIVVSYVSTHDNVSDFFTKPMDTAKFYAFHDKIMNESGRRMADTC